MEGIPNQGATCWLGTLVQCLRASKEWPTESTDSFTNEFLKLMNGSKDVTPFLRELSMDYGANDAQEALLFILDRLKDGLARDFEGSEKQTVITPKGRSESFHPCTVWFKPKSSYEFVTQYDGHNVCAIERSLHTVPNILVSDYVSNEFMGKTPFAIVHWGYGHYIASVKTVQGSWVTINDNAISQEMDTPTYRGYFAFYKD
jgi:ubiquitin C-terminal hydrolase